MSRPGRALDSRFAVAVHVAVVLAIVGALAGIVGAGVGLAPPVRADAAPAAPGAAYVAVAPCRLADTRSGIGVQRIDASHLRVRVAGVCGVPLESAAAALTVTVTQTAAAGYASVWPAGTPQPVVSMLNWSRGQTRANSAIVALNGSSIEVYASSRTQIVVDVSGAFTPTARARVGRYVGVPHARLLDTRDTSTPVPGGDVHVDLPNGVPPDAVALAVTVTTTNSGGPGYITAWASGTGRPVASVLNTDAAGQTRAVSSIVPVSATGLSLLTSAGGDLVVDVAGYFTGASASETTDGLFQSLTPRRVVDTRDGSRLSAGGALRVDFGIPNAAAIVANWTMTNPDEDGWIALDAIGTPRSTTSALNASRGTTAANMAVTENAADGIRVSALTGVDVIADVEGYFTGVARPLTPLPFGGVSPYGNVVPGPRHPERRGVLYVGDSLGEESQQPLIDELGDWRVDTLTYGGSAPCDWIDRARDLASAAQPDIVVFSFLGNSLTPCSGFIQGVPLLDQYDRDAHALCAAVAPAACVAIGQPLLGPLVTWTMPAVDQPTIMYRSYAGRDWGFVDAGSNVERPDGSYDQQYRALDGIHLTPAGGARYAEAIVAYLRALYV